jgi:hypothetical protein
MKINPKLEVWTPLKLGVPLILMKYSGVALESGLWSHRTFRTLPKNIEIPLLAYSRRNNYG